MNALSHEAKDSASQSQVQEFGYIFAIDNVQIANSDLIELHIEGIKRRMVESKHDRAAWEAAAIALCKTLDFMLTHIKKLMEHEITHRCRRVASGATMLTHKQLRAIYLVSRGYKNDSIAQELGISVPAVSQMLSRAYRALGVSTRHEAVVKCREYSWI